MTTIKNFVRYIKEELDEPVVDPNPMVDVPTEEDPEELFRFHLSDKLKKLVRPLKGDFKVAELLHNLGVAVPRKVLAKYPVDYIDIEDDGYFSYLKSRYLEEPDLWKSNRRVKQKITKAIREMYNETYLNSYVKEVDFVDFVNKLAALKDNEAKVYEWRGDEVLRAYNYKNECDPQFGYTCANFKQDTGRFGDYKEPTVDEFDIYTKNPENCGAVVVIESGLIKGRRSFQQGYNVCDSGRFRKDKIGTIWGNYYGISGRGSL